MQTTASTRTKKDYWILDRKQIQLLSSARRQDIIDRLAAEGPLSVRELAQALRVNASTLYHHLKPLLGAELIVEQGVRVVNRKQEKLYNTPSQRMRLRRALGRPEFRDLMQDIVAGLTRQMERDFASGLEASEATVEGDGRNLGFFRVLASPTPASLARINRHLDQIAEILWKAGDPDAPLMAVAWTMAPVSPPRTTPEKSTRK